MSFTFPDPSVSTTTTNPETGITYKYADGMWTPVSSDAEEVDLEQLKQRVSTVEDVNAAQSEEIEQNEELLEPVNSALINLSARLDSIETLDVASAVSALALAQQDIIELKSKVNTLELTSFLIME
jgi:chromosome segregation ATPase